MLKSPPGYSWLTSDNPGFGIDIKEYETGNYEITPDPQFTNITPDTVLYYPLSKDYCLRVQPYDINNNLVSDNANTPIEFEQSSEKELNLVNRLIFYTQNDVIISSDEKTLEKYKSIHNESS